MSGMVILFGIDPVEDLGFAVDLIIDLVLWSTLSLSPILNME